MYRYSLPLKDSTAPDPNRRRPLKMIVQPWVIPMSQSPRSGSRHLPGLTLRSGSPQRRSLISLTCEPDSPLQAARQSCGRRTSISGQLCRNFGSEAVHLADASPKWLRYPAGGPWRLPSGQCHETAQLITARQGTTPGSLSSWSLPCIQTVFSNYNPKNERSTTVCR